jgi:hypothetical protein
MRGLTRVSIGLETTSEQVSALERVFKSAEMPVLVDPEIARFSVDSPWVVYLTAPVAEFAAGFAHGAEEDAGADTWRGLVRFVDLISAAYRSHEGSVVFTDESSEVMIALNPELPGEAYAELLELDLPEIEGQRISWNSDQGGWYGLRGDRCPKK